MKRRRTLFVLVVIVFSAIVGLLARNLGKISRGSHTAWAIQALKNANLREAASVEEAIIDLNAIRRKAGLAEIAEGWIAAPSDLRMSHSRFTVLFNVGGKPVKVLHEQFREVTNTQLTEYEVLRDQTIGKIATWLGSPFKLFKVESTRNCQSNGLTIYYGTNGELIGVCEFVKDKPWNGRVLERAGFSKTNWDVSYHEGKLHGSEKHFDERGELERLRAFQAGTLHGLQQQFYLGQLRTEEVFEDGFIRKGKGWHQNGKLNSEGYFTKQGKADGIARVWNETGELEVEEGYRNGKEHGRRWWKGQQEVWFFDGKFLGGGEAAETEFKRLKK